MFAVNDVVSSLGNIYLQMYSDHMTIKRSDLLAKQEANFQSLKQSLVGTRIYEDLNLSYIYSYDEFVGHVPVLTYDDYAPYVEEVEARTPNILFKDKIRHFGLSSGTSGKDSKRVPYNEGMIELFIKGQKRVASRLSRLEPEINLLKAPRLTFGSDPCLYTRNGFEFGYISGILSTRVPRTLERITFPSPEVLAITDWDQKIERLIAEAIPKDIQVLSGIPTYIISILESVLAKTGKSCIREIWPHLKVFIYSATPIKQYKERIDHLVGHELNYYGIYASTEGLIGLPYAKYSNGRQRYFLNPDLLYSFSEVKGEQRDLGVHEIALGEPYYLNIGTPNGFIHYSMKDVVQFSEINGDLVFEFVGRKSVGMNLASEKVSEEEILDCYLQVKKSSPVDLKHFFLSPSRQGSPAAYQWTLFTEAPDKIDALKMAEDLDRTLQEMNGDYQDCREVGVLGPAQVRLLSAEPLQRYFENHRAKGQLKIKTTFETVEEYQRFLRTHLEIPPGVLQ